MEQYPIYSSSDVVGTAQAEKQGMYWVIRCSCRNPSDRNAALVCDGYGGNVCRIGTVPAGGTEVRLTKRIAVKQLEPEKVRFHLRQTEETKRFEVHADEPFPELSRLSRMRYDPAGKCLTETVVQDSSSPTGQ